MSKRILVCGAGGFIGSHLVNKLKAGKGKSVVDIKNPEYSSTKAFIQMGILSNLLTLINALIS